MGALIDDFEIESAEGFSLDQFSTSHTPLRDLCCPSSFVRCTFGAPLFAYAKGGKCYGVVQGCCNHWECPRCGRMVASKHYGRIVEGVRKLAKDRPIWFITITCRGADLSEKDATAGYLAWTSKLLNACRMDATRKGKEWHYVQVTEKQKRGHPHSHILTTWKPSDVYLGHVTKWETDKNAGLVGRRDLALRSDWLEERIVSAGLGEQYDLSKVETVEGASRYVAKYMFKDSQFQTHYPKRWKRVRYSQNFPNFPREKTGAFVLLSSDDWHHLASLAVVVDAEEGEAWDEAQHQLRYSDSLVMKVPAKSGEKKHVSRGQLS